MTSTTEHRHRTIFHPPPCAVSIRTLKTQVLVGSGYKEERWGENGMFEHMRYEILSRKIVLSQAESPVWDEVRDEMEGEHTIKTDLTRCHHD